MPIDADARPLHGRIAWITGASRGIGLAIAHEFARAGAHTVLGARSLDTVSAEAEIIKANGGLATALALDVSSWEACQAFDGEAVARVGPPDILVNNAGIGVFRPIHNMSPEEFESQFRVNVFGMYYMTRLAVTHMRAANSGHIVNMSSLAGESEAKMGSGYFATKHAVNGFSKCVLQDVREWGIRVTLVCPGSVDTRFHVDSHPGMHAKDQSWMVSPRDVAKAVLHAVTAPEEACLSRIDVRPTKVPIK